MLAIVQKLKKIEYVSANDESLGLFAYHTTLEDRTHCKE